jgi:hypothetical protein
MRSALPPLGKVRGIKCPALQNVKRLLDYKYTNILLSVSMTNRKPSDTHKLQVYVPRPLYNRLCREALRRGINRSALATEILRIRYPRWSIGKGER